MFQRGSLDVFWFEGLPDLGSVTCLMVGLMLGAGQHNGELVAIEPVGEEGGPRIIGPPPLTTGPKSSVFWQHIGLDML